jgi:hypothetical protein
MKLTTLTLSALLVAASTVTAFATCNGKHRISCAEGTVYDHESGGCIAAKVSS